MEQIHNLKRSPMKLIGTYLILAIVLAMCLFSCKTLFQTEIITKICCKDELSEVLQDKARLLDKLNKPKLNKPNREIGSIQSSIPKIKETVPYPYMVTDSCKTIANPCEIIVEVPESEEERNEQLAELNAMGFEKKDECHCKLELWALPDCDPQRTIINDELTSSGSEDDSGIQGTDYNRYVFGFTDPTPTVRAESSDRDVGLPNNAIRIAILDTGVDGAHDVLKNWLYQLDTLMDCQGKKTTRNYVEDATVDAIVNVKDDNGHGTHVAGVIVENLEEMPGSSNYRIVVYKTHDSAGISTMFGIVCAMYQAIEDEVDVINASWGYYGNSWIFNKALNAVNKAGIIVINSAGNDEEDVDNIDFYPAKLASDNSLLISVGAYAEIVDLTGNVVGYYPSTFTNVSDEYVEFSALGTGVNSTWPNGLDEDGVYGNPNRKRKCLDGTSMAAPSVTAKVVQVLLGQQPRVPGQVESDLFNNHSVTNVPSLVNKVKNARRISGYGYPDIRNCTININSSDDSDGVK